MPQVASHYPSLASQVQALVDSAAPEHLLLALADALKEKAQGRAPHYAEGYREAVDHAELAALAIWNKLPSRELSRFRSRFHEIQARQAEGAM
jgi:hypothetical protein